MVTAAKQEVAGERATKTEQQEAARAAQIQGVQNDMGSLLANRAMGEAGSQSTPDIPIDWEMMQSAPIDDWMRELTRRGAPQETRDEFMELYRSHTQMPFGRRQPGQPIGMEMQR